MLHQILCSAPVEDTAAEAASPVEAWTTDAWDD